MSRNRNEFCSQRVSPIMIKAWYRALCALILVSFVCLTPSVARSQSSEQPDNNPFSALNPPSQGSTSQSGAYSTNNPSPPETQTQGVTLQELTLQGQRNSTATREGQTSSNNVNVRNENLRPLPVQLTDYQRLVAASIGKVLPIFGANLFGDVPSTFAPVDRVPVTPEYLIGPGDELLIRLWGQVTLDGHFTVDRSGNVYLPQVGTVRVAGIPFAKLTDYLRAQIGRTFRNFDINVNIGQLRSIQVFVVGEAKRPGSYTVSSLSTLVNALFASGGPSPAGSLRNIQVKRNGESITTFDMYDLLLKGDKSKDIQLVSGDVIYIPPAGAMVAVAGSVDVPALYELKNETTISDLLHLSGGLSTLAQREQVRIERLTQNSRTVLDVKLDAGGMATGLRAGDIVEVTPIVDRFKDAVTLRGNVADPRRFAWHPGMRVRDIIPDKDALLTRDYWLRRNLLGLPALDSEPTVRRYAPDAPIGQYNGASVAPVSPTLSPNLSITQRLEGAQDSDANVYGNNSQYSVGRRSAGVVNETGNPPTNSSSAENISAERAPADTRASTEALTESSADSRANTETTSASVSSVSSAVTNTAQRFPAKNFVMLSAPEIDWAYAVVQRLNPRDLTTQLLPFNLGKAVLEGDNDQNIELEPGDVVTIFSKADLRVPQSQQTKYVRLEGEF